MADYEIKASIPEKKPRKVYDFKKADHNKIELDLIQLQSDFLNTWRNRDVQGNWNFFKNGLLDIVNKNVPSKVIKGNTDLPWITPRIKRILRKRKRIYKKAKETESEKDWKNYRSIQRQLKTEVKIAHNSYLERIFDINDLNARNKKLWT